VTIGASHQQSAWLEAFAAIAPEADAPTKQQTKQRKKNKQKKQSMNK
jgi:hypothetical protein